jgi:hypothetical protein
LPSGKVTVTLAESGADTGFLRFWKAGTIVKGRR